MMPSSPLISIRARKAFTLVELLVSITILVILATVTLYGMASVQKTAQIQRARSQVSRIHELLLERWESYEVRSAGGLATGFDESNPLHRLLGLRELIRLELPDRYADIGPNAQVVLRERPSLSRYYARRIGNLTNIQSAECLYLIISQIYVGDASALEFFSESEIGDQDGDGLPEILDPWGTPIAFVRWPAGYIPSPLVTGDDYGDPFDLAGVDEASVRGHLPLFDRDNDGDMGPDADPDDLPFAMIPLIVSAGPDRAFDIDVGNIDYTYYGGPYQKIPNDPYAYIVAGAGYSSGQELTRAGAVADTNQNGRLEHKDNITNHLLSTSIK